MKIAIGADHRGFELKEYVKQNLQNDVKWIDVGTDSNQKTDYPLFTLPVCLEVLQGSADYGVLICGSGIGMAIAANRFSQIYAGIAWNEQIAKQSKEDDNVNILILPADYVTTELSLKIIQAWLNAEFKGGIYKNRLDMIDAITDDMPTIKSGCC